ncbi:hypothetical protein HOLleu_43303 [Holothuria leucospilota]|uniref:Chitin-binding type-1 domain-containing protein n=1 Tax=Holothuria leucospilota TaxID=206669 RepID=A0A9Q1BB60_HOLLE|nr:hypothetical protein HOLleu_43303 [Holothuria leucospilota]
MFSELEKGVRSDGRCGPHYPLTNGQPGKCDPDSGGPCCSTDGWCGNTPGHCTCNGCIDYRELERGVRADGRCGPHYPLTNGQPGKCDPDSGGPCCSTDGWCGNTPYHCTCNGCIDYSDLERGVRGDGRCGSQYPLTNGQPGKCDPDSGGPCCSTDGWCGITPYHCTCYRCIDYRDLEQGVRDDGRCGSGFLQDNGQPSKCAPYSESPCCSWYGWCGSGHDYCSCSGCVDFRGKKLK